MAKNNLNDVTVRTQMLSHLHWSKEANKRKRFTIDFFNNALLLCVYSYNEGESKFNKKTDRTFVISENNILDLITVFKSARNAYTKKTATTFVTTNKKSAFGVAIYNFEKELRPCLAIYDCNDGMLIENKRSLVPFQAEPFTAVKEMKDDGVLEKVKVDEEFLIFVDKAIVELEDVFYGRSIRHSNHMAKYGKAISENSGEVNSYQKSEPSAPVDSDSDEFPF